MSKHFVAITESVPHCYHGGGGITAYAAVTSMLRHGHNVSVLALDSSEHTEWQSEDEHIKHLEDLGVEVTILPRLSPKKKVPIFNKIIPSFNTLFPGIRKREIVKEYLKKKRPDAIFMYHWNSIAATFGINDFPKLGVVGDPIHLPYLFRREFNKHFEKNRTILQSTKNIMLNFNIPYLIAGMKKLLLDCDTSGAFAAHHAKMFKEMGVENCLYFHTPVPDPLPCPKLIEKPIKLKIIHIGILIGIATLSGLELLAKEILTSLDKQLSQDSFEVHIIGGFFDSVPKELKIMLTHPNVKIRGPVYPPDEEFLSSHIVLVPTPIELGIRVRIINAFSFGSCVVAHKSNKMGIPELDHGVNCLLGHDGRSIADLCINIYNNPKLREKLGITARKTYEKYFSMESAGSAICQTLEGLSA